MMISERVVALQELGFVYLPVTVGVIVVSVCLCV